MSLQLANMRAFVGERAPAPLPDAPGAFVTVVAAGKGGVGTSTVATLLALVVAARGTRVLLVDAYDGHGPRPLLFGTGSGPRFDDHKRSSPESSDEITRVTETLSLAIPVHAYSDTVPVAPSEKRSGMRRLSALYKGYDVVVIDGGSRLESVLSACEGGVDQLALVTAADRICLAASFALVKALGERLGGRPVVLVGNRLEEDRAHEAATLLDSATHQFLERGIVFGGSVPDDPCLSAGVAAGMSLLEAAADSPAATAVETIAGRLFEDSAAAPGRSGRRTRTLSATA